MPAFRANRPDPGLGPQGVSSVAMKARRTATSLCDRETGRAGGKAQVNTARSGPHGLVGLLPKSWLEGTRRAPGGKGPIQHVQIVFPTQVGRWGLAGSQLLPAFQQADGDTLPGVSGEVGLWALGGAEIHRHTGGQLGSPGRAAGGHGTQTHRERRKGREERSPWQPSCFFQQWDICGQRKMESTVVTRVGDGSTADPAAGTPHTLLGSLNPSPLLQAFLAHLSICLCDKC